MAAKQSEARTANEEAREESKLLNALVGQYVLQSLGGPAGLHTVDVRNLWDHHYRVNVLVGSGTVSTRIAYSYFLVTDEGGKVLTSTPSLRSLT
jgi:hypothetical protein